MNKIKMCLLGTVLLVVSACSRNPVTGKKQVSFMSESKEKALGAQSDPQIVQQYGLYEDAKMQEFINARGKEMGAISHRPELEYQFRILDSPILNAFAVPGGYVYFTRGIMSHFNNEAEFAGVLGHEIGHITARHSAEQYTKQTIAQVLFIGGMIASPEFRQLADAAGQGMQMMFMKFSRSNESQSDKLGVEYSTEVGYNANKMAYFFKTLEKMSGESGSIPTFMSTHPDPGQRFVKVNQMADELQAEKGLDDSQLKVNRDEYLRMIDGIIYGEDPRQGFVENNNFYHPELLFVYSVPTGWRVQNTPSQVQMAPEDGKAMMMLELEAGDDLQTAANAVVERNKIKVLETNNTTVNGFPAIALVGEISQDDPNSGQQGQALGVVTYLIKYNGLIYKFLGVTLKTDLRAYSQLFQNTMKSFAKLTDRSKIEKKPTRIKIVPAKSNGTLLSNLTAYSQSSEMHEKLALVNGMELNEPLKSGMLFKIFEERATD